MNKEPIALYIFRFVMGFGLFAFMLLLYWSSVLIEEDMEELKATLQVISKEIKTLHRPQRGIQASSTSNQKKPETLKRGQETTTLADRPHIDPQLPNLLKEDPFYLTTLPKMLGADFEAHGTFEQATIGKPHHLHPFNNWSHINTWTEMCSATVAKMQFGKYETLAPSLAIKMEERRDQKSGVPEYWVHLREGLYWQPLNPKFFDGVILSAHFTQKHPVTAKDFQFFFQAVMNPYNQEPGAISLRNYIGDIEEIRVIDPLTFVVRWKTQIVDDEDGKPVNRMKYIAKQMTGALRPLASFLYQYFPDGSKIIEDDSAPDTYLTNSTWAQNFAQHWAKNYIPSCGPWSFNGMSDKAINFARNGEFYEPLAALATGTRVKFKSSPDSMWQSFKAGNLDSYTLQPDQQLELDDFLNSAQYQKQADAGNSINRLDYLARNYSYIGWNQKKPFFKSRKVRQALTMAIDRERIINQNLNGMGVEITGTFYRYSQAYDASITPWPFDPYKARRYLEEEGWYDSDGDGVIDKVIDGKRTPFIFSLTYYVKNPGSKAISEYIATALKEIGIICHLNGVDIADLSATFEEKSFDAIFLGWALGTPPDDPKQLWHSEGASQQGSSNAIGFSNPEIDAIIEALQYEYDKKKRIALYHRFDAIIHEEQPYTFLFSPKVALLYRNRLQNVFIPADRQDLIPGANVGEPQPNIWWLKP